MAQKNQNRELGIKGFEGLSNFHWNPAPATMYEAAITRGEGKVAKGGALVVKTGKHTGRSATDKFIVRDSETEDTVWWAGNASMTTEQFNVLRADFATHMHGMDLIAQDTFGGADLDHRVSVQIVTELACHGLFVHHLSAPTKCRRTRGLSGRIHYHQSTELRSKAQPATALKRKPLSP